jgi:hypothetical protein
VVCLIAAAFHPVTPSAQEQQRSPRAEAQSRSGAESSCAIAGLISAGTTPLPGVVVSLVDSNNASIDVTSTGTDGLYSLKALAEGAFTVKAELVAFAPFSREVSVNSGNCQQRLDLAMTLASRAPASAASASAAAPRESAGAIARGRGAARPGEGQTSPVRPQGGPGGQGQGQGRGGRGFAGRGQFQSLQLLADQAGLARLESGGDAEGGAGDSTQLGLPQGFSTDTATESVAAIGSSQGNNNAMFFGPNGPAEFAQRFGGFGLQNALAPSGQAGPGGAPGIPGGPVGFGGPGGGGGGVQIIGFGRGRGGNQIRGALFQSFDTSSLDAAPYGLNGQPTTRPDYFQQRLGANVGGPLVIPKVVNSPRTFFFLNYTGNHSTNPYDAYSTVPTLDERNGDLSALGRSVIDPRTGQPFQNNQIPSSRIDPAARGLLNLIPEPNQPGATQNFHTVTTTTSQVDDINLRVVQTFGQPPQRGGGRGGGGRGGFGGGRGGSSNLNIAIHYRRSDSSQANAYPTLGGTTQLTAWDIPVGYSFTKAGMFQTIRLQFNQQHSQTQNLFAYGQNVAGDAGLSGISSDPFDWGAPNLSFSSIGSVRDISPSLSNNRTIGIGDTIVKTIGRQTIRFGGDLRSIRFDSRTDANARGSFVFSGLYSGSDFADFLLGLPQQASTQFGPGLESFRQHTADLFLQDDWRATDRVTLNVGLRYEYYSPVSEASNQLVTLDAAPGFTAVTPVFAGGTGPYSGALPDTIVRPFRTGFAPRVGAAWRPKQGTVLRAGYGINYNSSVYQTIAQQLATQPPFAVTSTVISPRDTPIPLQTALTQVIPGTTTNTYAVDPNYRLPFVQIWNVDLQRDLTRAIQLGVSYIGTKGSDLDLVRAPNRGPSGLLIPGVAPFLWDSSEGHSILNALSVRLRKRLTNGVGVGGVYTLSKSMDDASSIAGGAVVVAQDDQNLGAEWGLSSFDQRHRFTGDLTYELPFGSGKRWLESGAAGSLLGNWVINGNIQLASGTPFTARILGNVGDLARGTNGTLRANYNGQSIAVSDPTVQQYFNTSAFTIPAPGTFGDAGRNTIIGPGTASLNLGVTRNINLAQSRSLSLQIMANNVLNTVQFATIDSAVNSPTFGQVLSTRPMRRVQILTRFRF